ncbi:SigE family RNA polymerase sigma factor [Nocardioides daeguensis]|uniref:SigE family RNA polymerase sigma factor n=1 Tax=Nocardioides daeguensis TaxID=908359 RepID=A0ABP6VGH2_9ACTN|nr:SigE family RNA polymerase sigma factor [Nocardioides daeguensis]MBV6728911.1 SigE family RNA polymerase sigma factor [Nocardioides daeguensis]MCR1773432.1 SigE family RNA polymerase sigma factor [Nocardioides daeguensis]
MDAEFAAFVAAKQNGLLRYGMLLTGGDPHTSADLAQETFLRLGRRWRHVRDVEHQDAYARRTMTRLWWTRSKRDRREQLRAETEERAGSEVGPAWESDVWAALQQLPPRQRAVLVLRYYEDCSEKEIAEVLGCRPGTVKSQASRGMASLRRLLGVDLLDGDLDDDLDGDNVGEVGV